jgi:predicted Zn-dependent peptidase
VEEINMYEDMPQRHVQDIFQELLYGDQSAGRNIAGTKENVRKMTRDDFIKYKNAHYVPKATTIVIAGHITIKGALEEARKHFGKMEHGVKSKKPRTKDSQKSPKVLISFKKTDQTHFVLGMRSYDLFSKKNTVLSVLGGVFGAGMSSRLFIKLREEMGAAYYVNAYNNVSLDHGVFQISAGVTNARTKEVISEILKECKKLKDEIIGEAELQKVKSFIIGNMKLSLEATDDVANFYGIQQLLKGEMKNIEEKAREIEKITSQDIQKIAREIFLKNQLNLCLIGPHTEKSGFMKILTI